MKRVSEINETIKFNNNKIGGMKEIMVKAHALTHLTRQPDETYADAFKNALKIIWRKIKRADRMHKHVYIFLINGRYAFTETHMDFTVACDYFCMLNEIDRRCESAVKDIVNDNAEWDELNISKDKLRIDLLDYINAYLPQVRVLEQYNANVECEDCTIETELRHFINNGHYKTICSSQKEVLIQFIYEYGFSTNCRIKNYIKDYGTIEKCPATIQKKDNHELWSNLKK